MLPPGAVCGKVPQDVAADLGVPVGTPVAASLVDAQAGGLALIAASTRDAPNKGLEPAGKLGLH